MATGFKTLDAGGTLNGKMFGPFGSGQGSAAVTPLDYSTVTLNVINVSTPALSTTYTQGTATRVTVDGFNSVTYRVKLGGTGAQYGASIFRIYGSFDNVTWDNVALHEFAVLSPQNGQLVEGIVQIHTQYPYLRTTVQTDAVLAPTSIVVDQIVGNIFSGGFGPHGVAINYYGAILEGAHDIRGLYAVNFNGAGIATAGYTYLSLFNPANAITNVRINQIDIVVSYSSNTTQSTQRTWGNYIITAQSGGTPLTPSKLKQQTPASQVVAATGNPTVTTAGNLGSMPANNSNVANGILYSWVPQWDYEKLSLSPGTGLCLQTPVAMTAGDFVNATIFFAEEI